MRWIVRAEGPLLALCTQPSRGEDEGFARKRLNGHLPRRKKTIFAMRRHSKNGA